MKWNYERHCGNKESNPFTKKENIAVAYTCIANKVKDYKQIKWKKIINKRVGNGCKG